MQVISLKTWKKALGSTSGVMQIILVTGSKIINIVLDCIETKTKHFTDIIEEMCLMGLESVLGWKMAMFMKVNGKMDLDRVLANSLGKKKELFTREISEQTWCMAEAWFNMRMVVFTQGSLNSTKGRVLAKCNGQMAIGTLASGRMGYVKARG